MPDIKNLDGLDFIRKRYPALVIAVISTLDFEVSIRQMIDLGANGFITKSTSKEAMKKAIIDILEGEIVILSDTQGSDCVYFTAHKKQYLSSACPLSSSTTTLVGTVHYERICQTQLITTDKAMNNIPPIWRVPLVDLNSYYEISLFISITRQNL